MLTVPLATTLLLSVASTSLALVAPRPPIQDKINLHRRTPAPRSIDEWGTWAKNHRETLAAKYGNAGQVQRRSSGTNLLVNQGADSSFYGSIAVGTPAISYDVVLDTGSSDLWLADNKLACNTTDCDHIPTFNTAKSSTFKSTSKDFSITYGSGFASGTLGSDIVQMAGFSVSNQVFGVCDQIANGLLTYPVSGLLGLAFETIASSGVTPFWEALVSGGAWDQPVMAFHLTRFTNISDAKDLEPGGSFTMGFLDSSLYTGDIDYNEIPGGKGTYWIQQMSSLTVQGGSVSLPSDSDAYAAIDTGTTLIGGPSQYIENIYSQIEGSTPGTDDYEGYYFYPCSTAVNITVAFGGKSWSISPDDFEVTQMSNSYCLGAFFSLDTGSSAPSWIFGDTFLKNVYSVFNYGTNGQNPSVGFAQLSSTALAMNAPGGQLPTPTIGSIIATVSATSFAKASNGALPIRLSAMGDTVLLPVAMISLTLLFNYF